MKIRHRIMLWVAGAGLLTSLVFSFVVFWELREQPLEMIDSQLKMAAAAVAEQLAKVHKPPAGERATALPISSDNYWVKVYDRNLRVLYQSELSKVVNLPLYRDKGDDAYVISTSVPARHIDFHRDDGGEVTFLVRVIPVDLSGVPYLIQIARPVEDLDEETFDLLTAIGIGLIVSTVLLVGLSYVLAGRIVKPIAAINRIARDINENTLEKRIPVGKSRDEIHDLAACLNDMFDRLQYSFARQKRFLADASHELKSPIAMLRLFFEESVQRFDLPDGFRHRLNAQGRNVLRMDRLVRTLLELSVLELRAPLTLEPFNIADLAVSVMGDFAALIERKKIRLETEMQQNIEMRGDKDKIRRALINIFDNAVKYNGEGGVIQLKITGKKDGVHLSLYNTGPGIPKEDLPRVFDQFYRVDKSRSTKHGGAGLGLAIVREIVRLHKGTVAIDSQEDLWTRVDIFLPGNQDENSPA
jgi:two-component system, OmpR family, sensor kinase